jgi:hypothetical protein
MRGTLDQTVSGEREKSSTEDLYDILTMQKGCLKTIVL